MEDLCDEILLKINNIKGIDCCKKIYNFLDKYIESINIIKSDYCDYSDTDIFDFIRVTLSKNILKAIHTSVYRSLPDNYLQLLSIILNLINLLYEYINIYNSKNITYTEQYKIDWFILIKTNYDKICNDFCNELPCMEGLIDYIEKSIALI